ncbi:MAG: hypothetical protein AB7H93_17620 [Vicinamibacterales bacterium]
MAGRRLETLAAARAGAAVDVAPACLWAALGAACAVAAARLLVRARPPLTASA